MVKDIAPGSPSSNPLYLACSADRVVFAASSANGYEPWVSDGTDAGTFELKDINPGPPNGIPNDARAALAACGSAVFFVANNGINGHELWKTDLTQAGTMLVKDIVAGSSDAGARNFACCASKLFFAADDHVNGEELWVSDGTAAGTVMVKDLFAGACGSQPGAFLCVGNGVYFSACVPGLDYELWWSDGTAAGTRLVCVNPGSAPSSPSELTLCNGTLYCSATHSKVGQELSALPMPGANAQRLGEGCPPHLPQLDSTTPLLGQTAVLSGSFVPPGHGSLLLVSVPISLPVAVFASPACCGWVDVAGAVQIPVASGPSWQFSFAVANDPMLKGAKVHWQGWHWDLATLFPLSTTNGVQWVVGN
jgi:ELWxxDGT repeat protein